MPVKKVVEEHPDEGVKRINTVTVVAIGQQDVKEKKKPAKAKGDKPHIEGQQDTTPWLKRHWRRIGYLPRRERSD